MITKSNLRKAIHLLHSDGVSALARKLVELFRRRLANEPSESLIAFRVLKGSASAKVMIDVGASTGITLAPFADAGWRVFAFEPDPRNRAVLERTFGDYPNVSIDPRAVSDEPRQNASFYSSEISLGISGLTPFHPSHRQTDMVDITTLTNFIQECGIREVDFLKVDTEGHDLNVLRGFPWGNLRPSLLMAEFDDKKTVPMGYSVSDLVTLLWREMYHVVLSEWQPISEYGERGRWKRFVEILPGDVVGSGWGNVIGINGKEMLQRFRSYCLGKYRRDYHGIR
jgi:FkbM family methyltransferase